MPTVESVKQDIDALGTAGKEEILNYLENEVKENRFSRGKDCPHCEHDEVSRNGKYHGKQRYILNPAEKLLLISHSLQSIIARKI